MNTKRSIQFHLNRVVLYEQAASILMFLVWFVLACFFFLLFFPFFTLRSICRLMYLVFMLLCRRFHDWHVLTSCLTTASIQVQPDLPFSD